jgi:type III secretion protein V
MISLGLRPKPPIASRRLKSTARPIPSGAVHLGYHRGRVARTSPLSSDRLLGADAALAALVVVAVGLMIVPLPTWVLDVLISANLSAAVVVLLVVLYVPDAIGIATFPTLLLLTTLFRLALNVASTRLILIQANAGRVIKAFGSFVVRGNYVVGAVVFVVLTTIQFIVIAKGSERVAEVGARFALDAMPGRQMAIDAELRAGTLDGHEARSRRRALQRESQFYGAMDGAMKFVKGDVIASIVIVVVNLFGGLAIGVVMHGMAIEAALRRYGLLTIGDGLVTQIPALVLSTAAGVLVTRVASEEADTPLGEELARQLLGVPKALQVASVFVLMLAAVPGLPPVPFLVLGVTLFFVGRGRARAQAVERRRTASEPPRDDRARGRGNEPTFVPRVVPWSIEIGDGLASMIEREVHGLPRAAVEVRERLFEELGVPLPAPRLGIRQALKGREVLVSLHEVPAGAIVVASGATDEQAATWVRDRVLDLIRPRAADFLGLVEVQRLLDEIEPFAQPAVRHVVPKPISLVLLADVLRRLVRERVSVRDLGRILEGLSTVASTEKDAVHLAEHARMHLRRAITFRLTGGMASLEVVVLDPILEDTVRHGITRTASGSSLALPPHTSRDVQASIRRAIAETVPANRPVVILTQPDIRHFVWTLLEVDIPDVHVVSSAELLPEVAIKPIAQATPA